MYGLLGYYKFEIGYKIKKTIKDNNIKLNYDISSNNEDRIYKNWEQSMSDARITLATNGSNVLNYDTKLQQEINKHLGISVWVICYKKVIKYHIVMMNI